MTKAEDRNIPNCGFVGYGNDIEELARDLRAAGADVLCLRSYWFNGTIIREWNVSWKAPHLVTVEGK